MRHLDAHLVIALNAVCTRRVDTEVDSPTNKMQIMHSPIGLGSIRFQAVVSEHYCVKLGKILIEKGKQLNKLLYTRCVQRKRCILIFCVYTIINILFSL